MLQATWGDLYKNKEDIDWCTENFAWFEDRVKCITYEHCTFQCLPLIVARRHVLASPCLPYASCMRAVWLLSDADGTLQQDARARPASGLKASRCFIQCQAQSSVGRAHAEGLDLSGNDAAYACRRNREGERRSESRSSSTLNKCDASKDRHAGSLSCALRI